MRKKVRRVIASLHTTFAPTMDTDMGKDSVAIEVVAAAAVEMAGTN